MNSGKKIVPITNHGHPGTFSYRWFYLKSALSSVMRPHKLNYTEPRYGRDSGFVYHTSTWKRWHRLCGVPDNIKVPFTVYGYSAAVGVMKVLKELGVNFRHLLHLKSEITIHKIMTPGESYTIDYAFEEALRIKADKAALVGYSKALKQGELYMEIRDHFVIKDVAEQYLSHLRVDTTGQFKGITRIPAAEIEGAVTEEIFIASNMARDYGHASGDRNIVHTTLFAARIFGYRRPFVQGLCTANLIMAKLCMRGFDLRYFSIVFCRPVYLKSRTFLIYNANEYRLQDEKGRVLCFGKIG
jgi:hypothetical protein